MRKLILAAVAAALLATAAVSTADARQADGVRTKIVAAVTLPSGEILGVGTDVASKPRLQIADKKKPRDSVRDWDKKVEDNVVAFDETKPLSTMRSGPSARAPIQGSSGGMRRK